jgi:hypothetical protein
MPHSCHGGPATFLNVAVRKRRIHRGLDAPEGT